MNYLDRTTIVTSTLIATATSLAGYCCYKWWHTHRVAQSQSNIYDTPSFLSKYLGFHYGQANEQLRWECGPTSALDFPKRCAELCTRYYSAYCEPSTSTRRRAIDFGCGVGRSSFELTRHFDEVLGVDYSESFIDACNALRDTGKLEYTIIKHGKITEDHIAEVAQDIDRTKVKFIRGDACQVELDGKFDCVLAANLLDRLHTPKTFLNRLSSLVAPSGILIHVCPYMFSEEYTPRENWIGGWFTEDGKEYSPFDGLQHCLTSHFQLIATEELPFLFRNDEREYYWSVAHASVWRPIISAN